MNGPRSRTVLLYKLLDAVYIVGLRIGEEMARIHLTPLALGLFSAFDKVEKPEIEMKADSSDPALLQIRDILTPALAFTAYICFKQLLGGTHLESNLTNLPLVKSLLRKHSRVVVKPQHRPATGYHNEGGEASYGASSGQSGNMIVVSSQSSQDKVEHNTHAHMIHKPAVNSGRHLKGKKELYIVKNYKHFNFVLKVIGWHIGNMNWAKMTETTISTSSKSNSRVSLVTTVVSSPCM